MNDQEFEEKKRFILEKQAQFASGMKSLEMNVARLGGVITDELDQPMTRRRHLKSRNDLERLLRRLEDSETQN